MRKKVLFQLVVGCLITSMSSLSAQNLVLNPSFEILDSVPCVHSQSGSLDPSIISLHGDLVPNWFTFEGTSDILTTRAPDSCWINPTRGFYDCRPSHVDGCPPAIDVPPFDGEVMFAGEPIAGELSQPLQTGESYCGGYWVRAADGKGGFYANGFYMKFGETLGEAISTLIGVCNSQPSKAPLVWDQTTLVTNQEWFKIESSFVADKAHQFIELDHFACDPFLADWIEFQTNDDIEGFCNGCGGRTFNVYAMRDAVFVVPLDARDLEITGPDLYCPGTPPITLEVSGGSGYVWSTLAEPTTIIGSGSRFQVSPGQPTSYIARCTLCGNTLSDTFFVDVQALELPPNDFLPDDSVLCAGESITLGEIFPNVDNYSWSTGSNAPIISVSEPGTYTLELQTPCSFDLVDSIRILDGRAGAIQPLLGNDTLICDDDVLQLGQSQADPRITAYQWSIDATTPAIFITAADTFGLTVQTVCAEELTDEIVVSPLQFANRDALLGPDRLLCPDDPDPIELDATQKGIRAYTWIGIQAINRPVINVPKATGSFVLEVQTFCDSVVRDTINLDVFIPPENWPPPQLFTQCGSTPQRIGEAVGGAVSYRWNTGDTTPSIVVNEAGTYSIAVVLECGQRLRAEIEVQNADSFSLQLGNAFTPNGDGLNDFFPGVGELPVNSELRVWSRWGSLIYADAVSNRGWDGTVDGKAAPEGVYIYELEVPDCQNQRRILAGTVTLLR